MRVGTLACVLMALAVGGGSLWGQEAAPGGHRRFEYRALRMGVEARLVLFAPDSARARAAARAAFDRLAELDSLLSDYRTDSEVERLAEAAGRTPVPISKDLCTILAAAQRLAEETDGAFDVTVGPVTRLWRLARRSGVAPHPDSLASATALVGWRDLVLDTVAHTAFLKRPGMWLDLGGIGKGYGADQALAAVRAAGVTSAMLVFGGEILLRAAPPGAAGWQVALDPGAESLILADIAVSTSGPEEQHLAVDGVRVSHVVDPHTGRGLTRSDRVTVIAPTGMMADALATAIAVMAGPARGSLIARHPEARVLIR